MIKEPSEDLVEMWRLLENSNYWTMVRNYQYNSVVQKALELGLLHECDDNLVDRTKYNYCQHCGKDIMIKNGE